MINLFGKHICPIGVDLGSGFLRMAQLTFNGHGPVLSAAAILQRPDDIAPRSPDWQRWSIEAIRELARTSSFKGRAIVTALPSDDLFIDQIKLPRGAMGKLDEAAMSKVQKKLPFQAERAILRTVPVQHPESKNPEIDVIVMVADRQNVDRHLAIYEKAGMEVAGISIWPMALINSYQQFFCRRKSEQHRVVILLDIGTNHCNVVICRGGELIFARVISTGFAQLSQGQMVHRMIAEVDACCRYYQTLALNAPIERLVLLSGKNVDKTICDNVAELAQKMQIPAQIGDVLSAIEISDNSIDRRNCNVDWATAFGLSLEGAGQ